MLYADVAPLPRALADHILQRFAQGKDGTQEEIASLFVSTVREKRGLAFSILDSYVRADALERPDVLDMLKTYGQVVRQSTYTSWRKRCLKAGMSTPLFVMGLLIAAMMTPKRKDDEPRQYAFLPVGGFPAGDTWYCYVQRSPLAPIEDCPANRLHELPANAICWTKAASPYWDKDGGWSLIGDDPGFLGCMRFAGVKRTERGDLWYDINEHDIKHWNEAVGNLYSPTERNTQAQIQDLCRPLFNRLAVTRLGTRK